MKGLALLLGKPKGGADMEDDDEAPPSSKPGSSQDGYADELADLLGVDESKRDAFRVALKGYVKGCMSDDEE